MGIADLWPLLANKKNFYPTMNSTEITWAHAGVTYKTFLSVVMSNPNPGGSVTITCTLKGSSNYDVTGKSEDCGSIFGYITDDGQNKFQSNNGIGPESVTPKRLLLFEGILGGTRFHVFACCRVSTVAGGNNDTPDDFLTVGLRNYLEVQTYNLTGTIYQFSDTKFTTLNLVKKKKS